MNTKLTLNYRLLIIGLPLAMIFSMVALVNSELYQAHGAHLAKAITIDLVLSTPLLYFLLIRKSAVPKFTVVSVFVLSMIAASYIIPTEDQGLLTIIKTFAIPIVEIGVISIVLIKARQIYKAYKSEDRVGLDFYDIISDATSKALPTPVNGLMATEIAVIYYALINWSKKQEYKPHEYSYHTKSGITSVVYAFMGLAAVELIVGHMLIAKYSNMWAWIATGITLYSLVQIFALVKSMSRRPIILDKKAEILRLRYGFFSQIDIPLANIAEIELSKKSIPEDDKQTIPLSPLGMLDSHNMVIHLDTEHELKGFYGIKKKFINITIYADDRERLANDISAIVDRS